MDFCCFLCKDWGWVSKQWTTHLVVSLCTKLSGTCWIIMFNAVIHETNFPCRCLLCLCIVRVRVRDREQNQTKQLKQSDGGACLFALTFWRGWANCYKFFSSTLPNFVTVILLLMMLMEEILHQLIGVGPIIYRVYTSYGAWFPLSL